MPPIVFISHSAKDADLAGSIHAFLNSSGIKALKAPDDIAPGTNWAAAITEMIEGCTHMVLVWTSNSLASQEVSKELTLAMQCGAVIIPFRSEDLAPEGAWRYHLSQVQWLEAHNMPEGKALEGLLRQVTGTAPARIQAAPAPATAQAYVPVAPETQVSHQTASQDRSISNRSAIRNKRLIAGLLALFLGGFGAHKFYLGCNPQGYLCLGLYIMAIVVAGASPTLAGLTFLSLAAITSAESITYFARSNEDFLRINIEGKRPWF